MAVSEAPPVDRRKVLRAGLLGGLGFVFVSTIGMVETFSTKNVIDPILSLGYTVLMSIAVWTGYRGAKAAAVDREARAAERILSGAAAGLVGGLVGAIYVVWINTFVVREVLSNISPRLIELLNFGGGMGSGITLAIVGGLVGGAVGALLSLASPLMRRALIGAFLWVLIVGFLEVVISQILRELHLGFIVGLAIPSVAALVLGRFLQRGPALVFGLLAAVALGIYSAINLESVGLSMTFLIDFLYESRVGGRALTTPAAAVIFVLAFVLVVVTERPRKRARARIAAMDPEERQRWLFGGVAVFLGLGIFLPMLLGSVVNELLATTGIFLLMGLGLNIVIGYAGLLDLGYVAFFAVGAYTTAILTSPLSKVSFDWGFIATPLNFWEAMPFVIVAAAIAGIIVGTPVIRMRGDYLAIVTLGFGEIARILFLSDWLSGTTGGAQGISRIPSIPLGFTEIKGTDQQMIFYAVFFFVLIAAYISWRLQDSRIGRSWMAMREDEQVAETMGVNIVRAKLQAFVIGAIIASFSGAVFAVKFGTIFPASFSLIVSITVLVVIIVGGMGNIPGVAVGALVMIGVLGGRNSPGLLREFEGFKLLIYGALLILMMLKRPEGLLPSRRRARELHQDEALQDVWLRAAAAGEHDEDGS
ncbi:MAG: hypothetical protein WD184_00805 [Acidimicrobiia bacterium]